jgi:hypothetical protein
MNETIQALQKLKVDCLYSKSTHFNAASRITKSANIYRILLISGTVAASFSSIMNVGVWDKLSIDDTWCQVLVNILGALGGFLILYTTTFSDYRSKIELANKHSTVGNTLNLTFKRIRNTEAKFKDGHFKPQQLVDALDELTEEFISNNRTAPEGKEKDYEKAREDIKKGYLTDYKEEELNC